MEDSPDQGTPERVSAKLGVIDFRRHQLHHRRLLLLRMKQFRDRNGEREEESEELCELEAIQEELEKLAEREEQLLQRHSNTTMSEHNPQTKEHMGPHGGVYVLPPFPTEEVPSSIPEHDTDTISSQSTTEANEEVVEVEKLNRCPALIQCPDCERVVTTETYSKVGAAAWILCIMSSMFGCVAGCCLIPFCLESLRDVGHRCPHCQTQIHTVTRL